jgi:hypothetical protein
MTTTHLPRNTRLRNAARTALFAAAIAIGGAATLGHATQAAASGPIVHVADVCSPTSATQPRGSHSPAVASPPHKCNSGSTAGGSVEGADGGGTDPGSGDIPDPGDGGGDGGGGGGQTDPGSDVHHEAD